MFKEEKEEAGGEVGIELGTPYSLLAPISLPHPVSSSLLCPPQNFPPLLLTYLFWWVTGESMMHVERCQLFFSVPPEVHCRVLWSVFYNGTVCFTTALAKFDSKEGRKLEFLSWGRELILQPAPILFKQSFVFLGLIYKDFWLMRLPLYAFIFNLEKDCL